MSHSMRFGAMIAASTVAMFVMMYFNSYRLDHVFYSETRTFMALYMGAVMAVIMLLFMTGMYRNRVANGAILIAAVAVFAGSLWLLRSQNTVQDVSWMKAMIPHHSIAILTSERAEISDPRVADLAERIFEAQRIEIAEMKALIADLQGGRPATPEVDGE
jgi:FlaA1/EpsC-like NDP-sugar epimerase